MVSSSSLPEKLSQLHRLNTRLKRLPEEFKTPSESTTVVDLQRQYSTSLHDEIDAEDVYHAIKSGYHCECDRPHPTKLGLPRIRPVPQQTSRPSRKFPHASTSFSVLFSTEDVMSSQLFDNSLSLVASTESLRVDSTNSSQNIQRIESLGTLTTQDDHDRRYGLRLLF